jgi:tetratricopeptide (TPR) repeat protein
VIVRHGFVATILAILVLQGIAGCGSREQRRDEHVSRAEEYLEDGKPSEALIELRNALKLDPQNGPLNYRIAVVLEGTNRLGDALFFYQEALRLTPQDSRAALATARLEMFEHPDRAETLINEVIAREPENTLAYIRRSELELARAKTDTALAAALTAAELDPKSHMALFQVGIVHRARIRERQLRKQPDDPRIFEEALAAFDGGLGSQRKRAGSEVVRGWISARSCSHQGRETAALAQNCQRAPLKLACSTARFLRAKDTAGALGVGRQLELDLDHFGLVFLSAQR